MTTTKSLRKPVKKLHKTKTNNAKPLLKQSAKVKKQSSNEPLSPHGLSAGL